MFLILQKISIALFIIFSFQGCMYYGHSIFPLKLDIHTFLDNRKVIFKIVNAPINLEDYYLNSIYIRDSNPYCQHEKYKKGTTFWSYIPQNKERILVKIPYGYQGRSRPLKENTLYTVDISLFNLRQTKLGGGAKGVFVLTDKHKIISAYNQKDIEKLCKEY